MFNSEKLKDKRIIVAVTGCIAAYKACYLVRELVKGGAEVRVMMTAGAAKFVTPLTMETLSNHPVAIDMFPEGEFTATHHIEWADWAEACLVVPATANCLAKTASGICDDFVSTVLCAASCPKIFAPAMNSHMWQHPATQRNIEQLQDDGALICFPEEGFLAEGYDGVGRLARLDYLMQYLYRAIHPAPESLSGKKVLITAGGTREFLDPVRMLTNRSSGKMGYALAWEAFARGAEVTLIHGMTEIETPVGVKALEVTSAADMLKAVETRFAGSDIYLSAAAIADYTPDKIEPGKIKKGRGDLTITLKRTKDILKLMGTRRSAQQILVGFAVETDQPLKNARKKLNEKFLDAIVLNNPLESGAGFAGDTNRVTLISAKDEKSLDVMQKLDVAFQIFDFIGKIDPAKAGNGR